MLFSMHSNFHIEGKTAEPRSSVSKTHETALPLLDHFLKVNEMVSFRQR